MDFLSSINGLKNSNKWNDPQYKKKKNIENSSEKESQHIEDIVERSNSSHKESLIDLQNSLSETQSKINLLDVASNTLDELSGSLNEMRSLAKDKIESLEGYKLSQDLEQKLENIAKIKETQVFFSQTNDQKDLRLEQIIDEFKKVSTITVKTAEIEGFTAELNSNPKVEHLLASINKTLSSVSSTKEDLEKAKNYLIQQLKSLTVTLENMASSYNRIRNVSTASEAIKLTEHQILKEAMKSINMQRPDYSTDLQKLVN